MWCVGACGVCEFGGGGGQACERNKIRGDWLLNRSDLVRHSDLLSCCAHKLPVVSEIACCMAPSAWLQCMYADVLFCCVVSCCDAVICLCPAAEKNSPQANPSVADTADVSATAAASAPVQVAATA
jgi:hypothetical protein